MVLAPMVALGAALRLSRWPRFALGMGTVAFFVVLTGAEPSVMRAGVMAGLALIGILLGRPRSTGSILAGAVLILLVIDPALVWSVEFQLSVAATASMVALASCEVGWRGESSVPGIGTEVPRTWDRRSRPSRRFSHTGGGPARSERPPRPVTRAWLADSRAESRPRARGAALAPGAPGGRVRPRDRRHSSLQHGDRWPDAPVT